MTFTKVTAMLREQFIRTGWQLAVVVGVALLFEWALFTADGSAPGLRGSYAGAYGFYAVIIGGLLAGAILLALYHDDQNIRLGLPGYVLRKPMSTWLIVLTRMAFNVTAMALVLAVITYAYTSLSSGLSFSTIFWNSMLVVLVAQTLTWWSGERPLVMMGYGFVLIMAIWLFVYLNPALTSVPRPLLFVLGLLPAYALCWYGTARQRRGGRAFVDRLVDGMADWNRFERTADFTSKHAAQRWLESYMHGGFVPAFAVFITTVICGFMLLSFYLMMSREAYLWQHRWENNVLAVLRELPEVAAGSAFVAAIAGAVYMIIVHYRLDTGSFVFTRPVTTRAIAQARIVSVARDVALTGAFIVAAGAISLIAAILARTDSTNYTIGAIIDEPFAGSISAALLLIAVLGWVWSLAWIHSLGLLAASLFLGILGITLGRMFGIDFTSPESRIWIIPGILLAVAVVWAVHRAYRQKLLGRNVLLWATGFAIFVFAGSVIFDDPANPSVALREGLWTALPFLLLPLAPIALVPLSIDWMRHR